MKFRARHFSGSFLTACLIALSAGPASATDWTPIKSADELRALFTDTTLRRELTDGVYAEAEYRADGTGELRAWGDTFERTWEIRDNDLACFGMGLEVRCFTFERDPSNPDTFRATNASTGQRVIVSLSRGDDTTRIDAKAEAEGVKEPEAGAAKPSADEIAASLANPNTPLASLNFKFQYRQFEGDLPGADDETGTGMIFQPTLPFPLDDGAKIIFRPAFPFQFDQPVFDDGDFESESGFGDIGYDLAYAPKSEAGRILAYGVVGSIPTATNDLGSDRWTLGPEFLIGRATQSYVVGALLTHQWDFAGSGDADISLSSANIFLALLPGGGWNVGTAPIMTYDHENDQATIPLNINFGRTVIWGGRPWKLGTEVNYFVDAPDAFAQEWFIGFNISPVVENGMAKWFQ